VAAWLQLGLGAGLTLAGWLLTRHSAGAGWRRPVALLLDALWPAIGFGLILAATARPILSGIAVLALAAGLFLADRTKRDALREPVVSSDMDEFFQLFRHPQLYLPFAGTGLVIGGALAAVAAFLALFLIEPTVWPWSPWPVLLALAAVVAAGYALMRPPLLEATARALKRFDLSGDPARDAASLGLLATLFGYGMVARAERASRRSHVMPPTSTPGARRIASAQPIVLVQSESFFDARRLHPDIPRDLLPAYDACCATALQRGRLSVPGWGANTMRTEFAALTGLSDADLGFDRFNPYHAFARQPVASLAWRLRAQGYRTICLHPFDRRFFRRDIAMPNLGFDAFLGSESFVGAERAGLYVTDVEVARRIVDLLASEGPNLFVFAITMENHGPWTGANVALNAGQPDLAIGAPSAALRQYLGGLRSTDRMIELLVRSFVARPGLLGFYGDHLPSLPSVFDAVGFSDARTDYFIWHPESADTAERDIAAHQLPDAMLTCVGRAAGHARVVPEAAALTSIPKPT
jgi:Sulfatase